MSLHPGCPVVEFDHWDPAQTVDTVRPVYADLLDSAPVSWSRSHGGFWILVCYDDVKEAASDPARFASGQGAFVPDVPGVPRGVALEQDPPAHGAFRKLYTEWLTPRRLREAAPMIRELTERYVSAYLAAGGGDFVSEVSAKLPVQVIGRLLGLDAGVAHEAYALSDQMTHGWGPDDVERLRALATRELELRRRKPREDTLTGLLTATVAGRPLTEDEAVRWVMGAVFAGHETTLLAGAGLMHDLARDPDLQEGLRRDPNLIGPVVEDSLRVNSPVQRFFRTLTEDVTLHGVTMRKGEKVMLAYAAANLDERRFPNSSEVRADREFTRHLGYGWGPHRCVGAPLATRELTVLAAVMVERCRFELAARPALAPPTSRGSFMGIAQLPLSTEPIAQ